MELLSDTRDEILRVEIGAEIENVIIGKKGLENLVPHRGMALCLDQVSYLPSEKNHLFANWSPGEEYFQGHFPEKQILPGHWQGESASIAAACLARLASPEIQGLPALTRLEINLKRPVFPGDTIIISVAITEQQKRKLKFSFTLVNDSGKLISEGIIIGMPMAS